MSSSVLSGASFAGRIYSDAEFANGQALEMTSFTD
jgi:hypothetical protein